MNLSRISFFGKVLTEPESKADSQSQEATPLSFLVQTGKEFKIVCNCPARLSEQVQRKVKVSDTVFITGTLITQNQGDSPPGGAQKTFQVNLTELHIVSGGIESCYASSGSSQQSSRSGNPQYSGARSANSSRKNTNLEDISEAFKNDSEEIPF